MKHVAICAECGGVWPCSEADAERVETTGMTASQWGRLGAATSWANTENRSARTAPARAALDKKFLDAADGDPQRAEHAKKAYYQRLAMKSAETRRRKAAARREAQS